MLFDAEVERGQGRGGGRGLFGGRGFGEVEV